MGLRENKNNLILNDETILQPVFLVNSTINPLIIDTGFSNFLQIEILGQGIYTYGALWLILTSVILLLSMIAPIILSRQSK